MTPPEPTAAPSPRRLLVAALLLYAFALAARIGPPAVALDLPVYRAGGEWLLVEPDGYLYLTGARDRLAGNPAANPRAGEDRGLSVVTAALSRATGRSLGEVAFFLPAFAGSLLVVPVLLLGAGGGSLLAGVLAALLAATAWGHLYRTIPGYFTPEMLNVVLPTTAALCVVRSFESRRAGWGWGAFAALLLWRVWYPPSMVVGAVLAATALALALASRRRDVAAWLPVSMLAAGSAPLPAALAILLAVAAFAAHRRFPRGAVAWIAGAAVAGAASGRLGPILHAVRLYVLRLAPDVAGDLRFQPTIDTVSEAQRAPLPALAEAMLGPPALLFAAALVGLALALRRRPALVVVLPLLAVGLSSLAFGLRFALYGVPVAALGLAELAVELGRRAPGRGLRVALPVVLVGSVVLGNLANVLRFRLPPAVSPGEARALRTLDGEARFDDYLVAFWETGYPAWYLADVRTLTDGGRNHDDNWITSLVYSTASPRLAANVARVAHERFHATLAKRRDVAESSVARDLLGEARGAGRTPAQWLASLDRDDAPVPAATRDLYLWLPFRMLWQWPTIRSFSARDLETGVPEPGGILHVFYLREMAGERLRFGEENAELDLATGRLVTGGKAAAVEDLRVVPMEAGPRGVPVRRPPPTATDPAFPLTVIVHLPRGIVLLADEAATRSLFLRMFVLRDVDPAFFEPVVLEDDAEVWKFRR